MAEAPAKEKTDRKRSGSRKGNSKTSQSSRPTATRQGKTTTTDTKGEQAQKETKETKAAAPKVYVFGGSKEAPQPGANGRRLWKFLMSTLTQADIKRIKDEIHKSHRKDDRFVRWAEIVAACEKLNITYKVGDDEKKVSQALVRSLQQQDKDGADGRDAKIVIF